MLISHFLNKYHSAASGIIIIILSRRNPTRSHLTLIYLLPKTSPFKNKMVLKTKAHQSSRPGGLVGVILRTALRVIQMIIALVIAGIYGQDLRTAHSVGEPADSRWVFAEVVAGLSIITTIVYLVPMVRSAKFFAWDAALLYVLPLLSGLVAFWG